MMESVDTNKEDSPKKKSWVNKPGWSIFIVVMFLLAVGKCMQSMEDKTVPSALAKAHPYMAIIMNNGTASEIRNLARKGYNVNKAFRVRATAIAEALTNGKALETLKEHSILTGSQVETLKEAAEEFESELDDVKFLTYTPLCIAHMKGKLELIDALLEAGADPNWRDAFGNTPIHYYAQMGKNPAIAPLLLRFGANFNAVNEDGQSPLHAAAILQDSPEMIAAIIEASDNVNLKDTIIDGGSTPLTMSLDWNRNTKTVIAFIKNGVNVNTPGPYDQAPLFRALEREGYGFNDCLEITTALIEAGADVNATFFDGEFQWSVLEWALSTSSTEMVMALIRNGVNVNAPADYNPLFHALERESRGFNDCLKITTALIEAGANVNATMFDGEYHWSVLEWASAEPASSSKVITMLIKAGAR